MAFKDLSWNLKPEKSHPEQLPDSMISKHGGEDKMVMKDKRAFNSQPGKKPYQKPEIRKIELRPEEAVLGGCKDGGTGGPGSPLGNCTTLSCFTIGS